MKQFRRSYCMVLFLREPESSELGFRLSSGTPVTRRPPHRSRRAVFPHRALQINSLSHVPQGFSGGTGSPEAADRKLNSCWQGIF